MHERGIRGAKGTLAFGCAEQHSMGVWYMNLCKRKKNMAVRAGIKPKEELMSGR